MNDSAALFEALRARLLSRSRFAPTVATRERIEAWIRTRIGDGSDSGMQAASGESNAAAFDARIRLLLDDAREYAMLESGLSPAETWLFRYPESFEMLRAHASASRARPFRVLLLGAGGWCEPCSVAAALHDVVGDAMQVDAMQVHAIDRDGGLFAATRAFGHNSVRSAVPDWARTALERRADAWHFREELSPAIRTEVGDIVDCAARHAREGARFDAVFFRNVAIYLGEDARRSVFARVRELLVPDGLLFVGHAEIGAAAAEPGFLAESRSGAFALRRSDAPVALPAQAVPEPTRVCDEGARTEPRAPDSSHARGSEPEAAPVAPRRAVVAEPAVYIGRARTALATGDLAAAEEHIGKALYLAPRDEEALVLAAEIADRRGARAEADHFRHRAMHAHLSRTTPPGTDGC